MRGNSVGACTMVRVEAVSYAQLISRYRLPWRAVNSHGLTFRQTLLPQRTVTHYEECRLSQGTDAIEPSRPEAIVGSLKDHATEEHQQSQYQ